MRDVTADDGLTERVRVLWMEARHFCSQTAWASCPSGTCSDCQVLAALALERRWAESPLPFGSSDSRKRWPGPGWKATSINPIVEHRKVSGPCHEDRGCSRQRVQFSTGLAW